MLRSESLKFQPDYVSAPGDTIAEIMEERQLNREYVAEQLGISQGDVGRLIAGELPITIGLAQKLALLFGASRAFWMVRECEYREGLAKGLKRV